MFGRDHHGVSSPVLLLGIIPLPSRRIQNWAGALSIMWQIWLWKITGHLIVHIPKRRAVVEE